MKFFYPTANLQFRTLPRQQPQQQPHLGVNRNPNDSSALVSVIQSPSSFMSGSIMNMGHHTIRRSTQSGLVESLPPTSMAANMAGSVSFYNRNPTMAVNTSQHQQYFYGWQQQMSPLPSPVVPTSILKQSINYQKPVVYSGNIGVGCDEDKEKRETQTSTSQWVSFDLDKHDDDVCL